MPLPHKLFHGSAPTAQHLWPQLWNLLRELKAVARRHRATFSAEVQRDTGTAKLKLKQRRALVVVAMVWQDQSGQVHILFANRTTSGHKKILREWNELLRSR